jgi:hypothetical protein
VLSGRTIGRLLAELRRTLLLVALMVIGTRLVVSVIALAAARPLHQAASTLFAKRELLMGYWDEPREWPGCLSRADDRWSGAPMHAIISQPDQPPRTVIDLRPLRRTSRRLRARSSEFGRFGCLGKVSVHNT